MISRLTRPEVLYYEKMGEDRLPDTGSADGVRVFSGNIPVGADVRGKAV